MKGGSGGGMREGWGYGDDANDDDEDDDDAA